MTPDRSSGNTPVVRGPFEQILGQLVAPLTFASSRARVLGMVGCRSGDGVTYISQTLAGALAERSQKRVLLMRCEDLTANLRQRPEDLLQRCRPSRQKNLWILGTAEAGLPDAEIGQEGGAAMNLKSAVAVIATNFAYCLLDCGAVPVSGGLWQVAPLVDEMLLVVAAGETTRDQISFAQRVIGETGARLSGCILNKRTYPLPPVLHRVLA